jgi:oxepin-CoA hydrolase/3-oxo-5,6-dehydrosuberyl-CoA semialdehyde dehydrogenase
MKKLHNYVTGQWITGNGEGVPMHDAITGEVIALSDTEGLDFAEILQYGRTKGGEVLRKMTFQERGNMLKSLALYLVKKKADFY